MRHLTVSDYPYPVLPLFSPCGRWLYGTGGTLIAVWDLDATDPAPVWIDSLNAFPMRFALSPCGRYVAGAEDRCVVVWDTVKRDEPKWLLAHPNGDHIADVAFTPDGTGLLTACIERRGGVRRWRVGNWHRKPAFATRANCDGALAVSPDGKTVATADSGGKQATIKLWHYPGGKHRKTAETRAESLDYMRYSPDGAFLVARDDYRRVLVWDARALAEIAVYEPPKKRRKKPGEVTQLAFHPSGRILAVAGTAGPVEFLDTATWRPARSFDWKHGPTYGVAFSREGTLAAAGNDKGKVVVWDVDL